MQKAQETGFELEQGDTEEMTPGPSLDGSCIVIVDNGERIHITPAWLYWQWYNEQIMIDDDDDERLARRMFADSFAREMFLGGRKAWSSEAEDFRRFCRCMIQGAVLGQDVSQCLEAYWYGCDFIPSPSWQNWKAQIGSGRTPPQFAVGDKVYLDDEAEPHFVSVCNWREWHCRWFYKAGDKWWAEDDLLAACKTQKQMEA